MSAVPVPTSGTCPRCVPDAPLHHQAGEAGEDVCPRCLGRFVPGPLAIPLLQEHLGLDHAMARELAAHFAGERLRCPGCAERTHPLRLRGAHMDLCLGCGGLWCDAGEFTRLTSGRYREVLAVPPPPPDPHAAWLDERWKALRDRWPDDAAHQALLLEAVERSALAALGKRYRAWLLAVPEDTMAIRAQERIVEMATRALAGPETPAEPSAPRTATAPQDAGHRFWRGFGVFLVSGLFVQAPLTMFLSLGPTRETLLLTVAVGVGVMSMIAASRQPPRPKS